MASVLQDEHRDAEHRRAMTSMFALVSGRSRRASSRCRSPRAPVGDGVERPAKANLLVAGAAVLGVGLLVLTTLALLRLTRVAAGHRRWSLPAVSALGTVWALCWLFGAQFVSSAPIASTSAVGLVSHEVRAVQAGVQDHAIFADDIRHDRFRGTPANQLLSGLRGKDVLLMFVESYGRVAVQDSEIAAEDDAALAEGTRGLQAAGFSARSAFLTSSTFGGLSWLAHSTLQSGTWVDNQLRYDQLVKSNRMTLTSAFKRAGWRTVGDVPSNNRAWPEGTSFYHFDKLYDRRNVGYRGPKFSYASMPDQYVLSALQRLELGRADRRPLFAEVDLVSSHTPWNRIPRMIDWNAVGDGSVFTSMPVSQLTRSELFGDLSRVRAAYAQSIRYTMNSLVSFVQHYGDDNLVLIVLGDHQPAKIITGENPSHDVPISVIAHDPAVLDKISGWGSNTACGPVRKRRSGRWTRSATGSSAHSARSRRPGGAGGCARASACHGGRASSAAAAGRPGRSPGTGGALRRGPPRLPARIPRLSG